jgi:hypothetical protein
MTNARLHTAARSALASLMTIALLRAVPAVAESGSAPSLLLPLVAAATVVSAARGLPLDSSAGGPARFHGHVPFLPQNFQIPDVYKNQEEDFIDLHRDMSKVDHDRFFWIDLLPHRQYGWMPSFTYDQESRGPLANGDELLRIQVEYKW